MSRKWWTGAILGWLFLGCCIAWEWADFAYFGAQSKILASVAATQALGVTFIARVCRYVVSVLILHALFGLAVLSYARLLCRGFAVLDRHPAWTLWTCWLAFCVVVVTGNIAWYPASAFADRDSGFAQSWLGLAPAAWIALGLGVVAVLAAHRALRRDFQ